jgi:hypothetical protein
VTAEVPVFEIVPPSIPNELEAPRKTVAAETGAAETTMKIDK